MSNGFITVSLWRIQLRPSGGFEVVRERWGKHRGGEWKRNGGKEGRRGGALHVRERNLHMMTCCITWSLVIPGGLALWITTICLWPSGWKSPFPCRAGWWGLGGSGGLASGPAEPAWITAFRARYPETRGKLPSPETLPSSPPYTHTHSYTHIYWGLHCSQMWIHPVEGMFRWLACVCVCVVYACECMSQKKAQERERKMGGVQTEMKMTEVCASH